MEIPKRLREQVKAYAREGFHVINIERRAGSHCMLTFAEFPQPQIVTDCKTDPRAIRNNLARYRKLAAAYKEKSNEGN